MFHIAKDKDISDGRVTDVYFERTLEVLGARNIDKEVRAEFTAKSLPGGWPWAVMAGIEEVARLMEGKGKGVTVRALGEGEIFYPGEPVMEVRGRYKDFCVFETALLGLICQASGVATKAARMKKAAGGKMVVSFGARRMHPAIAPMIERSAYLGGCDGVSVVASAELLNVDPMGTMPHSLAILLGGTVEAMRAYDEVIDKNVKRVALVDTTGDEKFESIAVAEAMGGSLYAIRLDTPGSRRGDFRKIFEEVRWELDLRGFKDIKLFASGGLDESEVAELSGVADAFGVGTSISNAPVVDFSMDIVEVDGVPFAKRGKMSGAKELFVCTACGAREVMPLEGDTAECRCGEVMVGLLSGLILEGSVVRGLDKPAVVREQVLEAIGRLE